MRATMWLFGALPLTAACNMYDGALLFGAPHAIATAPSLPDASAADTQVSAPPPDAGAPRAGAEPSELMADAGRATPQPTAAGGGGQAGFEPAGGAAGAAGVAAVGGAGRAGSAGQGGTGSSGMVGYAGASGAAVGGAGAGGEGGSAACSATGARLWADNGHCYIPLEAQQSWNLSRDRCAQLGAHLVTITSASEQTFVSDMRGGVARWMGLSKFGAASFSWISGEALAYTHWRSGAPAQTGEVGAVLRDDTAEWDDDSVSSAHAALCERP